MNVLVYSKANCPSCTKAKLLMDLKGVRYVETVIGEDILREDFIEMFPEQRTVPLIIIDGVKIGGYEDLRDYFDNNPVAD